MSAIMFVLALSGITPPSSKAPPPRALKCPSADVIRQQGLEAAFNMLFNIATTKLRAGDHLGALDHYRAALAALPADPQSAAAWNDMGWSLFVLGRVPEAIEAYKKALEINPDLERAKNNLAVAEKARAKK